MENNRILNKIHIKHEDLDLIKNAVAEAEKNTNGEIALAVIPQSDSYSFVEMFAAFCLAFVSFFIMLYFGDSIWNLLEKKLWYPSPKILTAVIGAGVWIIMLFFFLLINIPALDRLIIPKRIKEARVYARALKHFVECGIYKTAERTGVLIFVSILERKVFIIADSGIAAKVEQKTWNGICGIITEGLKSKNAAKSLCAAVDECGKILSEYFPKTTGNPNEYPDGLVVLEK
ncbi:MULTISPECIES: TPM domain-containing protein [unclassified Treponema]|uniref:TPM domain-containing protein n=1 Tax=unclassified Treponema TaxID=2638727 RepID=UPI0020A46BEE|nr:MULTISPECIES: TPM domain-containing protein [unclassified Treponema]UTC67379.1 TPM domain-containing protein [Treponema sp. OMZ 789]UTC70107.1 TPM domain-containing protein [Treponema sp. OMZ 790]UTC72822.1 TPM domain-containing protein [Treponema sp. OMZ 791]